MRHIIITPLFIYFYYFLSFRLTQCKENKCSLSTYDTQTLVTTMTPLDGIVKGIGNPG